MIEESAPVPAAHRQVLTFRIANEWYALDVAQVRRVEKAPTIVAVPSAPPALPGVFISQGQLIPAVDPRVILELPPATEESPEFVVIACHEEYVGGILVDWVDEVTRVDAAAIEPPPVGAGALYASGQTLLQGRLVSLLRLEALFQAATGEL